RRLYGDYRGRIEKALNDADELRWWSHSSQGAFQADRTGGLQPCRLCRASLETATHLLTQCEEAADLLAAWAAAAPPQPDQRARWLLGGGPPEKAVEATLAIRSLEQRCR
ncbi:unnamed protein product, partial [Prorocentrum cordatum]